MKQLLPQNALLALALALAGVIVCYNLLLRESFPVLIEYRYPEVSRTESALSSAGEAPAGEEVYFYQEDAREEEAVVLVTFPLDLNSATVEQLKFIPQVGEVTARRIVQYREALGGYGELAQLMEIKGIGEKTFETLARYLILPQPEEEPGQA